MKIPSNLIQTGKYTSGGEYVEAVSNKPYQGYYYELSGVFYAGKEYNKNAPKLIKAQEANQLYNNNLDTAIFSINSGITSQQLQSPPFYNLPVSDLTYRNTAIRFFAKKTNNTPILIREINENAYTSLKNDFIHQTIYIGTYQGITLTSEQTYSQMIGLKEFVEG